MENNGSFPSIKCRSPRKVNSYNYRKRRKSTMKIAVIGTGNVGRALGMSWADKGCNNWRLKLIH